MESVDEQSVERALNYLRDTAGELARAQAHVKYLEHKLKVVKGEQYQDAQGTVAEREASAYTSQAYKDVLEELKDAWYQSEELKALRMAAELRIEVWRSLEASKRYGNV